MRRLILFRHAKAEPRAGGGDDFDRALTERGREDAARVGQALASEGIAPDFALISPARRAAETWICARDAFPRIRAELDRALYNAAPETIAELVGKVEDRCDTLVVVGHNPGLQELAVQLLTRAAASRAEVEQVSSKFPTGTAAVFEIDPIGRASLDLVLSARNLGGEGDG
jgi:phosphohistidine phosphatase